MPIDYNPLNEQGPPPDPSIWVGEPSLEEQQYNQKVFEQMMRQPDALERLLAHNPDRPIVEECNVQLEQMGEETRLVSIEPTTACYEVQCEVCKEYQQPWSDSYYVQKNDGQSGYVCGDRLMCSARVMAQVFKQAVATDETPNFDDDDDA